MNKHVLLSYFIIIISYPISYQFLLFFSNYKHALIVQYILNILNYKIYSPLLFLKTVFILSTFYYSSSTLLKNDKNIF